MVDMVHERLNSFLGREERGHPSGVEIIPGVKDGALPEPTGKNVQPRLLGGTDHGVGNLQIIFGQTRRVERQHVGHVRVPRQDL